VTFRRRTILIAAAAVASAIVLGSLATYLIVRHDLRERVDNQLRSLVGNAAVKAHAPAQQPGDLTSQQTRAIERRISTKEGARKLRDLFGPSLAAAVQRAASAQTTTSGGAAQLVLPRTRLEQPAGYAQYISAQGRVIDPANQAEQVLPATKATVEVAQRQRKGFLADAHVAGLHVRVLTAPFGAGAIQAALPLDEVDRTLDRLALTLALVCLAGVAVSVGLGALVAKAALAPVATLTTTVERVSRTRDLSERIPPRGGDELGRLAASFNRMLAALEASSEAQRQLVADASHELRTPLASLLMNIELLAEDADLAPVERERVIDDLTEQIRELTVLVGDLVDLARDEPSDAGAEPVRLDELVEDAVARARRHAPGQQFDVNGEPTIVTGIAARLERAVNNLLDNAIKFNPPGAEIEIVVRGGEVRVRDHGPGFAEDDLPHIFDRFYRASGSRGLPGAGLGLAIVRQVADAHGGTIEAANAPGGGALLSMRLPVAAALPKSLPIS
jgi:two-component system sensor histidine kinase MprB